MTWGRVVHYRGWQATVLGSEGHRVWLSMPWVGVVETRARECRVSATFWACGPWDVS